MKIRFYLSLRAVLSVNIQSLSSKFSGFYEFISQVKQKNIVFDIIALQELWSLPDPDKFFIPGYQRIIFKSRNKTRGGGVGFYVKQGQID